MKCNIYIITFFLATYLIYGCSKEDTGINNTTDAISQYKVIVNVEHSEYGAKTKSNYQWPDGATLYIKFNSNATGTAVYNSSDKTWSVTPPQGVLTINDTTLCRISYFEKSPEGDIISLDENDTIYADDSSSYFLRGDTLTLTANLIPKTARLRFKGNAGEKIKIYGTAHYSKFNINEMNYFSAIEELELTVNSDGYTPYIHAFFPNEAKRLEITDSNNKIYIFKCSDEHLKPGASGYFDIPTVSVPGSWKVYDPVRTFKIEGSDAEFKMIFVQWIEGSYYIAETETTQALWLAIMNENPSHYTSETNDLPLEGLTVDQMISFIEKLKTKTGYPFCLPDYDKWVHAARGGNKSMGYRYSGSDTLDVVAWYVNNSDHKTHPVKTKKPNELGLYDMNGNVYEIYKVSGSTKYVIGGAHLYYNNGTDFNESDFNLYKLSTYDMYGGHKHDISGFRLCLNI